MEYGRDCKSFKVWFLVRDVQSIGEAFWLTSTGSTINTFYGTLWQLQYSLYLSVGLGLMTNLDAFKKGLSQ